MRSTFPIKSVNLSKVDLLRFCEEGSEVSRESLTNVYFIWMRFLKPEVHPRNKISLLQIVQMTFMGSRATLEGFG